MRMRHVLFWAADCWSYLSSFDDESFVIVKCSVDIGCAEMEFGSKYVYNYTDSEEESVSDDEFEAGIYLW